MASQLEMFLPPHAKTDDLVVTTHPSAKRRYVRELDDEAMVRHLEKSGNYRVLRRHVPRAVVGTPRPGFPRLGVIRPPASIIARTRSSRWAPLRSRSTMPAPSATSRVSTAGCSGRRPIPPEITRLTGITDAMVAGQVIDVARLRSMIGPADLVIAHNAAFDRPFCEGFSTMFSDKAWACSVSEVDWAARGFEGTKLGYLIGQIGCFHHGHRAVDDCFALLEVLAYRGEGAGGHAFAELVRASQKSRLRIFAEHSPFDMKDRLKARGYRWSDGSDGRPKSWWTEIDEETLDEELHYLRSEIYRWNEADPPVKRLTAFDRFKA